MNIEQELKRVIEKKLESGTISKMIEEEFDKSIRSSLNSLFSSYGSVTEVLKENIKEVMLERIEQHDFSEYMVKIDALISEFMETALEGNRKLGENFKGLLLEKPLVEIKLTDIWERWKKYVAEEVDTYELDVNTDDEPQYVSVPVTATIEMEEERAWSDVRYATIYFECGQDDKVNKAIRLWDLSGKWEICGSRDMLNIRTLRMLSSMEVFIMKLHQDSTEIILDLTDNYDDVYPEEQPEASFS